MMRLFDDECFWTRVSCTDNRALELFKRHYSYRRWRQRNKKNGNRFVGPGEEITLLSKCGKALFVWRKEKFRNDNQFGVNCAVFRNENKKLLSSELIRQATKIAWQRWPGERLFTFVNENKIESSNPGYCFQMAGWRKCGISKAKKLIILEKLLIMDMFNNQSGLEFINIQSEQYREYTLSNGSKYFIHNPLFLNVSESGGHRVFDGNGISHYIQPKEGWAINWKAKEGQPHFVK